MAQPVQDCWCEQGVILLSLTVQDSSENFCHFPACPARETQNKNQKKTLEQRMLRFSGYFVLRHLDARMCKGIEMHKRNSSLVHPRSSHCSVSKQLPGFPLNTRLCKKAQELGRTKCQKKCITHSMPMLLPGPSLGTRQVPVTAVTHVLPHRSLVNPCC